MECDQCLLEWRWCAWLGWSYACLARQLPTGFSMALSDPSVLFGGEWSTSITRSHKWSAGIPSILEPVSKEMISDSVELCDFRKWKRVHLMLISNLQGLRQNQNLETILTYIVVLCFPHNTTVWILHMCAECKRSNALNVCHKLQSIALLHEQVCSRTIKYQVCQYEPNIDISEQFVSKLWTILQLIPFLLLWIDNHPSMALRLEKLFSCFIRKFALSFHAFRL